MSAEAIATLRRIWGKLIFSRVNRVIAREPEDVLYIEVFKVLTTSEGHKLRNHTDYSVKSKRTQDIPEEDRWRSHVAWRHYYGFTDEGIYFQIDDQKGLDCDVDLTLDWSKWGNHQGGPKPEVGSMLAGEVIDTPKGKRFSRWFVCSPQFNALADAILNGTTLTEIELAEKVFGGINFPDTYWAIGRLVLFDNVQAFVDEFKKERSPHPLKGREYESEMYLGGARPVVCWSGMDLPTESSHFVHEISYRLNEPRWWEEFKRLAKEQGMKWEHPPWGGVCHACNVEKIQSRDPFDFRCDPEDPYGLLD
jgi:uncharacterized protein YndB with AHSA1/START domain